MATVRVMIVEDNEVNQLVFARYLERLGCKVLQAFSGEECLDHLKTDEVDLVLMDMHMPGLDGLATTRLIRDRRDTPVVMISADESILTRRKAREAGIAHFLNKPVKLHDLSDLLSRLFPSELAS